MKQLDNSAITYDVCYFCDGSVIIHYESVLLTALVVSLITSYS